MVTSSSFFVLIFAGCSLFLPVASQGNPGFPWLEHALPFGKQMVCGTNRAGGIPSPVGPGEKIRVAIQCRYQNSTDQLDSCMDDFGPFGEDMTKEFAAFPFEECESMGTEVPVNFFFRMCNDNDSWFRPNPETTMIKYRGKKVHRQSFTRPLAPRKCRAFKYEHFINMCERKRKMSITMDGRLRGPNTPNTSSCYLQWSSTIDYIEPENPTPSSCDPFDVTISRIFVNKANDVKLVELDFGPECAGYSFQREGYSWDLTHWKGGVRKVYTNSENGRTVYSKTNIDGLTINDEGIMRACQPTCESDPDWVDDSETSALRVLAPGDKLALVVEHEQTQRIVVADIFRIRSSPSAISDCGTQCEFRPFP